MAGMVSPAMTMSLQGFIEEVSQSLVMLLS
jgi:hypothetical protein